MNFSILCGKLLDTIFQKKSIKAVKSTSDTAFDYLNMVVIEQVI